MQSQEEIISFLDFLDLDEDIIDKRLKSLMVRNNHSNRHLTSILQLLLYKNLINKREDSECDNNEEFDFIVKLLKEVNCNNVDHICKIVKAILCLNETYMVSKGEHLLQQILSNIDCQSDTFINNTDNQVTLTYLKVCDCILDTIIGEPCMLMINTPLENILDSADNNLITYFLTNTVPKLVRSETSYFDILHRIWNHIYQYKGEKKAHALKVLSSLSDYYLPVPDTTGYQCYVSVVVTQYNFWSILLFGFKSNDPGIRKISVYLAKKALDYIISLKEDINIKSDIEPIFVWSSSNREVLKSMWDDFFILIDSLEEQQSNIVLPSLRLFDTIDIEQCWLNCAFNLGLKHDNTQVRLKCLEYRLNNNVTHINDAVTILQALNDINLYDQKADYKTLKENISNLLHDTESLLLIIEAIPNVNWSPVPLYHLTDVLANLNQISIPFNSTVTDLLKVPCNSIVIRKAVYINIVHFIKKCCPYMTWMGLYNIFSVQSDVQLEEKEINPIMSLIKDISVNADEKQTFYNTSTETHKTLDYMLKYLSIHEEDIRIVIDIVNEKFNKIQDIVDRQYSDKRECIKEAIFLMKLLKKTSDKGNVVLETLYELIAAQNKTVVQYLQSLMLNDTSLSLEEIKTVVVNIDIHGFGLADFLLQLYKTCVLLIKDTQNLDKTVLSAVIIKHLMKDTTMITVYKHEMFDLKHFLNIFSNLKFNSQSQSLGRLQNVFHETSCDIVLHLVTSDGIKADLIKAIISFIEDVTECGGYGCLRLILQIVNNILEHLVQTSNFNLQQFITRTWKDIEELKSNNQYAPCIKEFINLITHDVILANPRYNNIVMLYFNNIIEYGPMRNMPLYYLVKVLHSKNMDHYGHLVYMLCEILMYCPVLRKDQRIVDNITLEILRNPKFGVNEKHNDIHFNNEIQMTAVSILTKIKERNTLKVITTLIRKKIDDALVNKQRYHGNSQLHRTLLVALQNLLILLLKPSGRDSETLNWCLGVFVRLPHQTSVRICFEWYISLCFYIQKTPLNCQFIKVLKANKVPLTSQFFILYWLLKRKLSNNACTNDEYEFVMDYIISHTMGQLFNVRLHAQYFARNLYMTKKSPKYGYIIDVIDKTFNENSSDKNYVKLKNDYFANEFDIIENLNPYVIFYVLPRYCGDYNEDFNINFVKHTVENMYNNFNDGTDDDFNKEWLMCCKLEFIDIEFSKEENTKTVEDIEAYSTIQKKYIPWRNMSDVNVYVETKRETPSELIVVASLIDKLPNLGGMARTSEVFGVKTYVVDSLRHLQDKQFQGLSVSAEKWINVEEVQPGRPLKEYLGKKKSEGYILVAAEQTSNSCKLQEFRFRKKTLLLLGHEKEGIPCDLLPIMDYCVEIPQQGYVRSLNVHVTAAIFIWEYARRHVLYKK